MAPKERFTEEVLLDCAFEMARKSGIDSVNARDLAKELGCSTKPIFRLFASMDDLKYAIYELASNLYNERMFHGLQQSSFLGMGLAYINFAREEKKFFELLFLSDKYKISSFSELLNDVENQGVIALISNNTGLTQTSAKSLFIDIWLTTHGIATMCATNTCDLDSSEIESILKDVFEGVKQKLLNGENK
ncbi:TetR/AcrR family transcriptional regulator [Lysinibacillus xylanilyticus]|uniref:TetR/AcrR family transcriptional regulator n=1 Tax=Lysinibacillus xylanilyticus TaxID=582475 RepID=UPI00083CA4E9|nr:TetR/AcrR family transcriptional regulator [Lysinibacillus xylanilyticus]